MITVDIANPQTVVPIDRRLLRRAVQTVLRGESVREAKISLAVVDDATIRDLNRQYLDHDEPTDVLSFLLERCGAWLEGEVVVGAQTAVAVAAEVGWSAAEELVLYVVHGVLHLVGYEDATARQREQMRAREAIYLEQLGLRPGGVKKGTSPSGRKPPGRTCL